MDNCRALTLPNLISICHRYTSFPQSVIRSKAKLLLAIEALPETLLAQIIHDAAAEVSAGRVRYRRSSSLNPRPRKKIRIATDPDPIENSALGGLQLHEVTPERVQAIIDSDFLRAPTTDVLDRRLCRFIDASSNFMLQASVCASCARARFKVDVHQVPLCSLPNRHLLVPANPHPAHTLFEGLLLHRPSVVQNDEVVLLCQECMNSLRRNHRPQFSLANNMWVGEVPQELQDMTLPEQMLIALYFPAAFIVKLYPKQKGARAWDQAQMHNGLRGNVSTYRLDPKQVASIVDGTIFPPPARILSATIGVTFVGPKGLTDRTMPNIFRVRRWKVRDALLWLKANNPLYAEITISERNLAQLPADGIPEELLATAKYSSDVARLEREHAGYVPLDAAEEDPALETIMRDAGLERVDDDEIDQDVVEPGVFPLQSLGVVDIEGQDISDSELFSHALSNTADAFKIPDDFTIRRGSAFVNEYARADPNTGLRNDGGPSNPNHLLGCFPTLFPYGQGGFEVARPVNVPYEAHARWAMEYCDRRFRTNRQFPFQVFGVIQKRQVCRSAVLQMKKSTFKRNITLIKSLKAEDLLRASEEETRGAPFSHPGIRALRNEMTGVRTKVKGTDESRFHVRSKIWGTNLLFGPPILWFTVNPADTQNPIAQVLAGADGIDLDAFSATAGPDHVNRAINIAQDPFAAAQFFQFTVNAILHELFGIQRTANGRIEREEGVLGKVQAYIGTVEAQGRGTLHLHMLIWLKDAPNAHEMQAALLSDAFRAKLTEYIRTVIHADINGLTKEEILQMPKVKGASYCRPLDPRLYTSQQRQEQLANLVRSLQYHKCTAAACLKVVKGRMVCKRRAPWATAARAWVDEVGNWGPKRLCDMINAFNPTVMKGVGANHDLKLVLNGKETATISFYVTNYATKKQNRSSNVSALLAKSLAFSRAQDRLETDSKLLNKRLIQRCANSLTRYREFSGPEVMTYIMGWGDVYASHHYVTIFWDNITRALEKCFPELKASRAITSSPSQDMPLISEGIVPAQSSAPSTSTPTDTQQPFEQSSLTHDSTVQMDLVDGQLILRDELRDYQYRGRELRDMNFLDFVLSTYDGPISKPTAAAPTTSPDNENIVQTPPIPVRGRPPNSRVMYREGRQKPKRCRILRTAGHETLPRFVGKWFPRNNARTASEQEMYAASMLALLKPWEVLWDLRRGYPNFASAYQNLIECGNRRIHTVIHNIQYYYDCLDGAKARRQAEKEAERTGTGDPVPELSTFDLEDEEINAAIAAAEEVAALQSMNDEDITEEDIEAERIFQTDDRERVFGEAAMTYAYDAGIFPDNFDCDSVEFGPLSRRADLLELPQITTWAKILKDTTRQMDFDNFSVPQDPEVIPIVNSPSRPRVSSRLEVLPNVTPSFDPATPISSTRPKLAKLNTEQRRAHDIVERTLKGELEGTNPPQLRMLLLGQGGTGKSTLISAITETFVYYGVENWLARTATTGIAAVEIRGTTIHSWAGLSPNVSKEDDWAARSAPKTREKRRRNIEGVKMLILDEVSMLQKRMLFYASEIVGTVMAQDFRGSASSPFGGMHVILSGDFHQFPPVGDSYSALYVDHERDDPRSLIGRAIFRQFDTVVMLTEQVRVTDAHWNGILNRLRVGECDFEDIKEIQKLVLTNPSCDVPDFQAAPWADAILVTPRHSVRQEWNEASLLKHCRSTGNLRYICPSEDIDSTTHDIPRKYIRLAMAHMDPRATGKLSDRLSMAEGMKAMVVLNLATEADIANGTRGVIERIVLDPRELDLPIEDGTVRLQYPPVLLHFRPDKPTTLRFDGLDPGLVPITPTQVSFTVNTGNGRGHKIKRRQYALTAGYAFTDYKSQGQTLEYVVLDLAKPPTGELSPFAAYVALSRSRGRDTIRILRDFDRHIFQNHPSRPLEKEMERLERLNAVSV